MHFMMGKILDVDTNSPRGIKNANSSGTFQLLRFCFFLNGHTLLSFCQMFSSYRALKSHVLFTDVISVIL